MSAHSLGSFIGGVALGVFLGVMIPTAPRDMPDPTPEQMIQMMSIYCGKDGCQ